MADELVTKRIITYNTINYPTEDFANDDVLFVDGSSQGTRKVNVKAILSVLNGDIDKAIKSSNVSVTTSNYSSIITNINDQPINSIYAYAAGLQSNIANLPSNAALTILHYTYKVATNTGIGQVMIAAERSGTNDTMYFRTTGGSPVAWSSWQKLATSADIENEIDNLKADLTTNVFNITYNETFSEVPSINPVKIPYAFDFVEGKTYHFKIECVNVNPSMTQTNQFMVDASTSANPSISNIPEIIYRSGSSLNVYTGAILEFDYTPTRSDLHGFLLRYRTNTGVQNFTVDITTTGSFQNILNEIQELETDTNNRINSLQSEITNMTNVNLFSDTYNETFSEVPSINPVRIPYAFDFVEGKTYHFKIECVNVNPLTETNQFLVDGSTSANPSISNIPEVIYRSGSSANVHTGAILEFDYTPTRSDLHGFLLRYKTNTGVQNFTVDITTTGSFQGIEDEYQSMLEKIKNVQALIPNQSRMEFGAHRGAESFAPPNSVAAYEIAGKMGFQWAWLAQIRWSASKTLYVMHDEDVSITTNGTGNLSELTDEYIESLLCNKIQSYDYSKFTNDDLRVPTLEKVIQICVKYGMKMCFRIEPFPADMDTEGNALIWNNFANLIKEYNIKDGIYSGYNADELKLCRTLIGDNENLCLFRGNTTTGQDYINFFTNSNITGKRSVLLYYQNATQSDIKLLHKNGIEVYVFYNGTRPSQNEIDQWAIYGVEILQNPNTSKLTI